MKAFVFDEIYPKRKQKSQPRPQGLPRGGARAEEGPGDEVATMPSRFKDGANFVKKVDYVLGLFW
jgi:hypothetical protein